MSCPHVTGHAAILLGLHTDLTPAGVKERVMDPPTKGETDFSDIPMKGRLKTGNCLLYVPKVNSPGSLIHQVVKLNEANIANKATTTEVIVSSLDCGWEEAWLMQA